MGRNKKAKKTPARGEEVLQGERRKWVQATAEELEATREKAQIKFGVTQSETWGELLAPHRRIQFFTSTRKCRITVGNSAWRAGDKGGGLESAELNSHGVWEACAGHDFDIYKSSAERPDALLPHASQAFDSECLLWKIGQSGAQGGSAAVRVGLHAGAGCLVWYLCCVYIRIIQFNVRQQIGISRLAETFPDSRQIDL